MPTVDTICAIVVTYYPDAGFAERMERVSKQVGQIVVVDNRSQGESVGRIQDVVERLGVHLISSASNGGIASALNAGIRWAASQGHRWVLTLDQDTIVAENMVSELAQVFRSCPFSQQVAAIGSNHQDRFNQFLDDEIVEPGGFCGREVKAVMTSGTLVSVDRFTSIGGFREDFFMDCVDYEYCLRARSHGYRILMTSKAVMDHSPGIPSEHRILWKNVRTSNHSSLRRYFMARNITILVREYIIAEPKWIIQYLWKYAKSMVILCLFEKQRMAKIKRSIRGCIDGILGRTTVSVG